jgi:hypothetical protein
MSEKPYEYLLFIDEAGDDSLKRVRPIDETGGTEWLAISGFLVRHTHKGELENWLREIRADINSTQGPTLHFRKLSPSKKRRACQLLASKPCKAFVVLSNKKNLRGYTNKRAGDARGGKNWFYNFCVRLLMERATDACFRDSQKHFGSPRILKVVFSNKGGHSYGQTKAYWEILKNQAAANSTFLKKREIRREVLRFDQVDYLPHYMHPGLQFADIVASAFYQASDELDVKWDPEFARLLSPIIATEHGVARDYGICLQPTPCDKGRLTENQKVIFREFGYKFSEDVDKG